MKLRRTRWLVGLCAVMLVASNAVAAVRACSAELGGNEHLAAHPREAQTGSHVCPDTDDATRCLSHCTQSAKSTEPNLSSDAPTPVLASISSNPVVSFRHPTVAAVVADPPRVVGRSLTILFRKLRN